MLLSLLFTLIPTLVAYWIIHKIFGATHLLFRLSLAWFLGQYVSVFAIFLAACTLNLFTTEVLLKATLILLACNAWFFIYQYRPILNSIFRDFQTPQIKVSLFDWIFVFLAFTFSYFFFLPHLEIREGIIFRSYTYWDFPAVVPQIQNFAFGDNFPPQNEQFAGAPMSYHFMPYLHVAIFSVLGLDLVGAINFYSIVSFSMLLITLYAVMIEIFSLRAAAFLAVLLTISSSSLKFYYDFISYIGKSYQEILDLIIGNPANVYWEHILRYGCGHNGNFYDLFYFVEERQLIDGVLYMLVAIGVLFHIKKLNKRACNWVGFLCGMGCLWHLFITITVLACCGCLFILWPKYRLKLTYILIPFVTVFALHSIYFKMLSALPDFLGTIKEYPVLNFNYAFIEGSSCVSDFLTAIQVYVFAYGFKIPIFILSCVLLYKRSPRTLGLMLAFIIPTFILINTVQLSPLSISENHKWHRPINVIIDMLSAYGLVRIFLYRSLFGLISGSVCLFLLTVSGVIQIIPYFNSKPSHKQYNYNSDAVKTLREMTMPSSTFVASSNALIRIAGRKLYVPAARAAGDNNSQYENYMRFTPRIETVERIYATENLSNLCSLIKANKIDYIEINSEQLQKPVSQILKSSSYIEVEYEPGEKTRFYNIAEICTPQNKT